MEAIEDKGENQCKECNDQTDAARSRLFDVVLCCAVVLCCVVVLCCLRRIAAVAIGRPGVRYTFGRIIPRGITDKPFQKPLLYAGGGFSR